MCKIKFSKLFIHDYFFLIKNKNKMPKYFINNYFDLLGFFLPTEYP